MRKFILPVACLFYLAIALAWNQGSAGEFDRLADADRKAFGERFAKEVYPLLSKDGKDGCVGCHSGKLVSALKLTGDATKDYHFLLKEGFFDYGDKGSLLGRITDTDKERRMPLHPRESWKKADIEVLHNFVRDLAAKQKK